MKITFKGTRGTRPVVRKDSHKYGGNTSCVLVEADGQKIIFDAGTGINNITTDLDHDFHVFLSHVHYDHIQGFPFFKPLFGKKSVKVYGVTPYLSDTLEQSFKRFIEAPYLPFSLRDNTYSCKLDFQDIGYNQEIIMTENLSVFTGLLKHPFDATSYKLVNRTDEGTKTLIYATDCGIFDDATDFIEMIKDADLLIMDSFFTNNELYCGDGIDRTSWGHASWEYVVDLATKANVKSIALFHHHDSRTDDDLDEIERQAQKVHSGAFCCYDEQTIEI